MLTSESCVSQSMNRCGIPQARWLPGAQMDMWSVHSCRWLSSAQRPFPRPLLGPLTKALRWLGGCSTDLGPLEHLKPPTSRLRLGLHRSPVLFLSFHSVTIQKESLHSLVAGRTSWAGIFCVYSEEEARIPLPQCQGWVRVELNQKKWGVPKQT